MHLLLHGRHNSKTGKCAACETATQGIFNMATDVQKRMKADKKKAAGAKAAEDE